MKRFIMPGVFFLSMLVLFVGLAQMGEARGRALQTCPNPAPLWYEERI